MDRYDIRVNVWGDVSGPQYEWETVKAEDGDFVLYADAQATVEALQAQLREGEAAYHNVGEYNDRLKQQVEALQRERDHAKKMEAMQKEVADNQTWYVRELRAALDAERERYELLNVERNAIDDKRHVLHEQLANTIEAAAQQEGELAEIQALAANLKSQLTQLQALVRALVCTMGYVVDGSYILTRGGVVLYACSSSISAERLGALLAYRATLPATPTERGEDHSGDDTDMVQKGGGDGE